ncbi:MAG: 3-methyl-2-oxobutanoate hydroxymethyltransferase [Gemmatimonadetes bacterium]|nr:3-methyl-2-oxobutanoate hydroxymethyltransferase [Gemmatimonadota bacterium]
MNVFDFRKMKSAGRRISMTTCYDYWSARILDQTPIDALIVGDSAAMVMHGHESTLPATPDMLAIHTQAVARGAHNKFIIADMPFLSFRKGLGPAIDCVQQLVRAGANAVKLEGVGGHDDVVKHIVQSGVPVMGHLGLTPQAVNSLGGFKVQGVGAEAAADLVEAAQRLEAVGCFSLVLEAVPTKTAQQITENVQIPTIGIGAGPHCDGQVLVLHDLAGFNRDFKARFVRMFEDGHGLLTRAVEEFDRTVKNGSFPSEAESYE